MSKDDVVCVLCGATGANNFHRSSGHVNAAGLRVYYARQPCKQCVKEGKKPDNNVDPDQVKQYIADMWPMLARKCESFVDWQERIYAAYIGVWTRTRRKRARTV